MAALRQRAEEEGRRCREQGIALDAVLLFGSRARGDHDGFSDIDLIVVGRSARDAAAAADRLAAARLGDDLIPLSHQAWVAKRQSPDPYWRAMAALKGCILELDGTPPRLGAPTEGLRPLRLNALSRMATSSHYPDDDRPPLRCFDRQDAEEAIACAAAVLSQVERWDSP